MIHVRRANETMGALRFYPGTHHSRLEDAWADAMHAGFNERFPLEGATAIEAEAGDVLFFHFYLVHGSMSGIRTIISIVQSTIVYGIRNGPKTTKKPVMLARIAISLYAANKEVTAFSATAWVVC